MISIEIIDRKYCVALSEIISTDTELAKYLHGPDGEIKRVSEYEFFETCKKWEHKKGGYCYVVLLNGDPIGTVSYAPLKDNAEAAGVGFYIASPYWGKGYGTKLLKEMIDILKHKGYKYVTGSVPKGNIAPKRVFEKCGAEFKEDKSRYYPIIRLQ